MVITEEGYFIDDDMQWHNGKDYDGYCFHFDNVMSKLFYPNKFIPNFRNILIIGGGDLQLLSNTRMLSEDGVKFLVDPCVHSYQELLEASKDKISSYIYNKQRECYLNPSFTEYIPVTIQEFIADDKYKEFTYDLIVCDLTDNLATDENNEYIPEVWNRLRSGGVMIGYGGDSMLDFILNSSVLLYGNSNIILEEREYKSWKSKGVVYGIIKR